MTDKADKTLEEFLDGKSSVSRDYAQLGDARPPAALDRTILAAARSAVEREEDATVIRVRHWRKWSVSAALAATVVVAVPLVVRVIDLGIDEAQPPLETQVTTDPRDAAGPDASTIEPGATIGNQEIARRTVRRPAARPAPAPAPTPEETAPMRERRQLARSDDNTPSVPAVMESGGDAREELSMRLEQAEKDAPASITYELEPAVASDAVLGNVDAGSGARSDYLAAPSFLDRITASYRNGQTHSARREFGEFLVLYPEAGLPDDFPLERSEAIAPQRTIIREADGWLGDIATLARKGRIDAARQELARFFERYPDYELPGWFPLTRDDAAPIER